MQTVIKNITLMDGVIKTYSLTDSDLLSLGKIDSDSEVSLAGSKPRLLLEIDLIHGHLDKGCGRLVELRWRIVLARHIGPESDREISSCVSFLNVQSEILTDFTVWNQSWSFTSIYRFFNSTLGTRTNEILKTWFLEKSVSKKMELIVILLHFLIDSCTCDALRFIRSSFKTRLGQFSTATSSTCKMKQNLTDDNSNWF